MKQIVQTKQFAKHYGRRIARDPKLVQRFDKRLRLFVRGERGWPLYDHPLKGPQLGQRAFWIKGDLRVVYKETGDAYIFLDVGSHNQVY